MTNSVQIRILSLPGRKFKGGNPYFRLFCDALSNEGHQVVDIKSTAAILFRFDVVHVHFPEHYVTEQSLFSALKWTSLYSVFFLISKMLNKKVVWSVHDVLPFKENHAWLLKPYMNMFRALTDAHVFLSLSSRKEFSIKFPAISHKPFRVVPHGPYPVTPEDKGANEELRYKLLGNKPAFVIGFLGNIKKYKNPRALIDIPTAMSDGSPIHLIVAGKADKESFSIVEEVKKALGPRLIRIDRAVSDNELSLLIRAVDVVFLPYMKGWNSGFAMLVLSNRQRLITSDLAIFKELNAALGDTWVRNFYGSDMTTTLAAWSMSGPNQWEHKRLNEFLEKNSFQNGAKDLIKFYRSLM